MRLNAQALGRLPAEIGMLRSRGARATVEHLARR